jgi:hypothetical protein
VADWAGLENRSTDRRKPRPRRFLRHSHSCCLSAACSRPPRRLALVLSFRPAPAAACPGTCPGLFSCFLALSACLSLGCAAVPAVPHSGLAVLRVSAPGAPGPRNRFRPERASNADRSSRAPTPSPAAHCPAPPRRRAVSHTASMPPAAVSCADPSTGGLQGGMASQICLDRWGPLATTAATTPPAATRVCTPPTHDVIRGALTGDCEKHRLRRVEQRRKQAR